MFCTRTTILLAAIALATPAAAQLPRTQVQRNSSNPSASSSASANRWLRQLANDLDHLQEDLLFERGKFPQGLQEQIDQVAQAVAHFQTVQAQRGDPAHLQRDFQEMDEQIHELVNNLEKTGDSWLRRQASRIRYSDEQLHYALRPQTAPPGASPRELLVRQAHLLETTARDLRELAARVNRRDGSLDEAIREFDEHAEHFHGVVEKGADAEHLRKDFQDVDDAWHQVVELLNRSSYIYYLRSAAQDVNRVHNQVHELVSGHHDPVVETPAVPPQRRRPAIQFEIPGIGRFQIPQ
ncbi:MAG TPA: hypothetical protein VMM76_04310 [Pirellulaceae bacterium]|nr:hypothetical protein [Pirellulaceae bacterium]